jgi:predicted O-methyltransferase YrrM
MSVFPDPAALRADASLPWSEWALRPEALAILLAEIRAGRRNAVECGSGVSTIVLARALAQVGGTLHALEHDAAWAECVRSLLRREGLDRVAPVVEAPLRHHPLAAEAGSWYDADALAELPADGVDLLLVDGPPAGEPRLASGRYPALPVLGERLAADALVVLDDIDRPGEVEVAQTWERETRFRFQHRPQQRIALGRRGQG